MTFWLFLVCAVVLSMERVAYYLIWRFPDSFSAVCELSTFEAMGGPVDVLEKLFYMFKVIQVLVFVAWCMVFGETIYPSPTSNAVVIGIGVLLITMGMALNLSVFLRLGKTGVFYGIKFGYEVPWQEDFPYSLCRHPQYLGALLAIWGFFLAMRFPYPDWWLLPIVETVYYGLGAHLEQ